MKADCDNDFFLGDYGDPAFGSVYARCLVFTVENPGMRNPDKVVGDNIFSVAKTILMCKYQ